MVYFLGDWGMGDSDLSSYQQHVPNIQQPQRIHGHDLLLQQQQQQQQLPQQQQQQRQQQQQQQQQQLVAQISSSLSQLQPQLQLQFASGSSFLQQGTNPLPSNQQQHVGPVSSSSLVTANLQQLSGSSSNSSSSRSNNNATSGCNTPTKPQPQQQQLLLPEAAAPAAKSLKNPQLSKDLLDNEDEVALHPLSNQVSNWISCIQCHVSSNHLFLKDFFWGSIKSDFLRCSEEFAVLFLGIKSSIELATVFCS